MSPAAQLLERFMPRGHFARSVVALASGTAIGQAVVIMVSPILTRLYTPADFGVLSLYMAVVGILGVASALRYEFALPIAATNKDAAALAVLSGGLALLVSLLSWVVLVLTWKPIEAAFNLASLRLYIWLVPLGIASIGMFNVLTLWGTRDQAFGVLAQSRLTQGVGIAGTQVGAGLMAAGGLGLITGDVLGRVFGALHVARRVATSHTHEIRALDRATLLAVLTRFRRFPLISAPASFFNALGLRLPVILVAAFYGIEPAGWLMLSQRVVGTPMTLIGQSVSRVYAGELGRRLREDPASIEILFLRMSWKLALFCTLPILLLAVAAPATFEWIFGDNWYTAGQYTRLLALMLIAQFIVVPVSQTLTLLERQELQLAWDVTRSGVVLMGFWLAAHTGLDDLQAVAIYCGLMAFMYGVLWAISFAQVRRSEQLLNSQ